VTGVWNDPHFRLNFHHTLFKSKLYYDRQSVGQSILVSGTHLGPATYFSPSFFCFDSCWFLDVRHPPWREDGSVIYSYSCFWTLSDQWLSGPGPAELMTVFYCLIWDSLNLEGQVSIFIPPPPEKGGQVIPPGQWVPYLSPLTTRRATVEVF
jgi:hypothetical protein